MDYTLPQPVPMKKAQTIPPQHMQLDNLYGEGPSIASASFPYAGRRSVLIKYACGLNKVVFRLSVL